MNYLAHLSLAQPNSHSLTGNLLGDFMHGVVLPALPPAIQAGVANHRAVDRFTDHHAAVIALKPLFNERYRRFAGIIIDISFDYFLSKHWLQFMAVPRPQFLAQAYQGLLAGRGYMPARMQQVVERMAEQDWLSGYDQLSQVGFALDRVAERIRFSNDFRDAQQEVEQHYVALEQAFLALYPALQQHIAGLGLEQGITAR